MFQVQLDTSSDTANSNSDPTQKILTLANLLSISRLPLGGLAVYCLALNETFWAVALFVIAAVTDFLDGFVARRAQINDEKPNKWGVILDPVADKLFAIAILVGVILYREFPLWIAGLILVRDLGILVIGSFLLRGRDMVVPSNLPGKYYFAALAVLLVSYLTQFDFGISFLLPLTGLFWLWSTISYVILHKRIYVDQITPESDSSPGSDRFAWLRISLTCLFSAIYLYKFLTDTPFLNW